MRRFEQEIATALGGPLSDTVRLRETGRGRLPAWFPVSDLAAASVRAAALELAALTGAGHVDLNRDLALRWFDMTLRPRGWSLPSAWDVIAGDYAARDGWIRLHTNAPHHRAAALRVLSCPAGRDAVARRVAEWDRDALEAGIVQEGGCAASMHTMEEWARHPQGRAVAQEPLIAWQEAGDVGAGRRLSGLAGVRILDLTRVLAGPVATRFLAGFGAEVLRIDPPDWAEPGVVPEVTLGKRCAGLDLRQAADRAIFTELLRQADVLVHGYRPGALEGLGFGAAERRALNPGLIDVSLCAYGWTGPWAGRRGFDSLVQMSAGIAAEGMARARAERPLPLPVQALDHATGYLMAAAVLRALRLRRMGRPARSARVSLARVAALLVSAGAGAETGDLPDETDTDLSPEIEQTSWGPARRVCFPVELDGVPPRWPVPAGELRRMPARWDT